MKVGILGYWYATNYGSACTYYALYTKIKRMGLTPLIIDIPEKELEPNWDKSFARKFIKEFCSVSESVKWNEIEKVNDFCDTFVIGSDQVWNRDAYRISRGFFFLNFVNDDKGKIAYAPSFGSDKLMGLDSQVEYDIGRLFSRFDDISVREKSGMEILHKRYGIESTHVIDPVFFLSNEDYKEIAKLPPISNYLLAYILDPTEDKERFIQIISEHYNLPVVVVLDGRFGTFDKNKARLTKYRDAVVDIGSVPDWLGYFINSECVVTDSFHGMSISLINKKRTFAYANPGRGYQRFTSLLNVLELTDILYNNSKEITSESFGVWSSESIQSKISKEVIFSENWLQSAFTKRRNRNTIGYAMNIKQKCTGCGACSISCPKKAITMQENAEGFLNPSINENLCSNCGKCISICPSHNPIYLNEPTPECYAVWAQDEIRAISSSGGVFTVLSEYILQLNGVVYGAAYSEGYRVHHIRVTDITELEKIRGSKYIQSNLEETYLLIRHDLNAGRYVLFSGMPCQIAGLKSFLSKNYKKLFTIDLLCHGIAPYSVFDKYHQDVLESKPLVDLQFKSKKPWGWHAGINAKYADGSSYSCIIEKDPYFVAYIKGLSKNKTCGRCPFNRLPRQGDISIGDFWKIQDFCKEYNDNKGTSLVLINNSRGKELFEDIKSKLTLCEKAPLEVGISGNGCIKYPYKLHQNRDEFFENLADMKFDVLVNKMVGNVGYPKPLNRDVLYRLKSLYYLANYVNTHYNGRKLVMWGDNAVFKSILHKYFNLDIHFIISDRKRDKTPIKNPEEIANKSKEYYLICYEKAYSPNLEKALEKWGYVYAKDYICRMIKPIILTSYDLSNGYTDEYGNKITKTKGIINSLIIRGFNNTIEFGMNINGFKNLQLDITANSRIYIENNVQFTQPNCTINVQGHDGDSIISIGENCRFMSSILRIFNNVYTSIISIGKKTTFGEQLRIHANSGKRVSIGKDCMFSREIVLLGGDGHSIFDVRTGNNINSLYSTQTSERNSIVIGDHVWVGDGAMVLYGSEIGEGSIIGAKCVVKKKCNNNCSLVGNPAKVLREDVAWCHDMCSPNINSCAPYAKLTSNSNSPLMGKDTLVIGGSQNNGIYLIKELLANGNKVTVANRGHHPDPFGDRIERITLDVSSEQSTKLALSGKKFDVVFNNISYSSQGVKNILDNVKCSRFIQLSSVYVYEEFHEDLKEEEYTTTNLEEVWSYATKDYPTNKRLAELALNAYPNISSLSVRIPYVYYTDRFDYYCEAIVSGKAMNLGDMGRKLSFVTNTGLSHFLVWVANQPVNGVINYSSEGHISIGDLIRYIENNTKQNAIITQKGEITPFNENSFTLNLCKIKQLSYVPEKIEDWIWTALDHHISRIGGARK